jgi:hypothetical protein
MMKLKLIDYSLLLAVEKLRTPVPPWMLINASVNILNETEKNVLDQQPIPNSVYDRHRYFSSCGRYVYHISTIDYLTRYNIYKQIESFYKVKIKRCPKDLVSCIDSDSYGKRFVKFMETEVIVNEEI